MRTVLVCTLLLMGAGRASPPPIADPPSSRSIPRGSDLTCQGRLLIDQAIRDANGAVRERVAALHTELLRRRDTGAAPLAAAVTSWAGKWQALKPWLPGTDSDGHRRWIAAQVAEHLGSDADLDQLIRGCVAAAACDLAAIENRLAVALAALLSGPDVGDDPSIDTRGLVAQALALGQWSTVKTAASLGASELGALIGTQVLLRLGVSTGILAAGAANSWWSFGGSVVLGVVADVVWERLDDPTGDVEAELRASLTGLAIQVRMGLAESLHDVVELHATHWRAAVEALGRGD